jgi:molecular chaperone GrpE
MSKKRDDKPTDETALEPEEPMRGEPVDAQAEGTDMPLEATVEELRETNLRIRADFDNFRKRVARERADLARHAKAELARKLLPVLDNLERAVDVADEQGVEASWLEGLRLVRGQFLQALAAEGIEPVEVLGQEFDPEVHEVVATLPNEVVPRGWVVAEVQRGYRMGDTVVRAARVVTSSGDPDE